MEVYNRNIIELENSLGFQYFEICHECAEEYDAKVVERDVNSKPA
jgi:hypothetical protein